MNETEFELPGIVLNKQGNPRRVGIEIEMSGIELAMIVCQINIAYGGQIKEISRYEFLVENTSIGNVKVELDSRYLKKIEKQKFNELKENSNNLSDLDYYSSDLLGAVSKNIIPCELIAPPLPIERLHELNNIVKLLRDHGAKGTRSSLFYAFGVHLNPELPDLDSLTILNYLKAFICLQDWLIYTENIDYTRKLSPFINDFSDQYKRLVLSSDYQPDSKQLIDDYLQYNPTRNRIMDLLPVLACLDEQRIIQKLGNVKLNKRPTLHYRLPNSDIDNPQWGLWQCWNDWVEVEKLANTPDQLEMISTAYIQSNITTAKDLFKPWLDKVKEFLPDL